MTASTQEVTFDRYSVTHNRDDKFTGTEVFHFPIKGEDDKPEDLNADEKLAIALRLGYAASPRVFTYEGNRYVSKVYFPTEHDVEVEVHSVNGAKSLDDVKVEVRSLVAGQINAAFGEE